MSITEEALWEGLEECSLFRGLKCHEIQELLGGGSGRIRSHASGSLIAQAGDEVLSLQILLQGRVKGEMNDDAGRVIKIEDILPPRPLAPAFLFGKQNSYPVNITAAEDVKILVIPRELFLTILQDSGKVLVNFVNIISSRGQFLSDKIRFLSFSTIKGKLARYLLDQVHLTGSGTFLLSHSQSQLSELFGVARPSIGRAISELNRDGFIRTEGKQVHIPDPSRLSELLRQD